MQIKPAVLVNPHF